MSVKFNGKRSPAKLPYRPVAECYLMYKGKLIAQDAKRYLSIPGGGIDSGESPIQGAKRELMEELGAVIKGTLSIVSVIEWDWDSGWANTDKRKKRYMKFRGERVYSMIGEVANFKKPTSDEGDAWVGKKTMSLAAASKLSEKYFKNRTKKINTDII